MSDPNNTPEPDMVETFKKRLLGIVAVRMEGRVNRESPDDLRMFDELLTELLEDERIVLSRAERKRLHDELLASF